MNDQLGLDLKEEGMWKAEEANERWLELARMHAKRIAQEKGTVTADDVRSAVGVPPPSPHCCGCIFIRGAFEFTGDRIISTHPANRGRELKVWRLRK